MKKPQNYIPLLMLACLGLAVTLLTGAVGTGGTSIERFDAWDNGTPAAGKIWTALGTTRSGVWSNNVTADSVFLPGPEHNGQGTYIFNTGGGVTVFSNSAEGLLFSWNGALGYAEFFDGLTAPSLNVTGNVHYAQCRPAVTTSNIVVSFDTNRYQIRGVTNLVLTNLVEQSTGGDHVELWVYPVNGSIPLVWPAYGPQHGYYFRTNVNNAVRQWAAVTNPCVISFDRDDTNILGTIIEIP